MAKTVALNSLETVWVTTYHGGETRGTCFDISIQMSVETQITATFTVSELLDILRARGTVKGLAKPVFDAQITESLSIPELIEQIKDPLMRQHLRESLAEEPKTCLVTVPDHLKRFVNKERE